MQNLSPVICVIGILKAGMYFTRNSQLPDNHLTDFAEDLPVSFLWKYITDEFQVNSTSEFGDIEFTFRVFHRPGGKSKNRRIDYSG